MDNRLAFIADALSGLFTMVDLCARYEISRKTGYKWLLRYEQEGVSGLMDRSRAPHVHGRATAPEIVAALLALKAERPRWGPRKLVARLGWLHPELDWPGHTAAGAILKRAGLTEARRPRRKAPPSLGPLTLADQPNRVWAADHKGWVRLGNGRRLEPLTITDGMSRFLISLQATSGTTSAEAKPLFERAFEIYGLPDTLRTDNGSPFASAGVTGLTQLSAWWIRLGIKVERIAPGKPQQNGRHERFHATLMETMTVPAADAAAQQARFDTFRAIYNIERPHEALGQAPPASVYRRSARAMPKHLPEPDYPPEAAVRMVRPNGEIKWAGDLVYISEAITGQPVAIEENDAGDAIVRYFDVPLGYIDRRTRKLRRNGQAPPQLATPNTEPAG
jgi:putative transposase